MSQNIIWNNDMAYKLIELFRERRLLWDCCSADFKNRCKKQEAWQEIADYFGFEKTAVEKKMKMLVGQYRREVLKTSVSREESKWYAYNWLKFLTTANDAVQGNSNAQNYEEEYEEDEMITEEQTIPAIAEARPLCKRRRSSWKSESRESVGLPRFYDNRLSRDEHVVFGEYVANKMRNITNKRANATTQFLINKILYNAEMGMYDDVDGRKGSSSQMGSRSSRHFHNVQRATSNVEERQSRAGEPWEVDSVSESAYSADDIELVKVEMT